MNEIRCFNRFIKEMLYLFLFSRPGLGILSFACQLNLYISSLSKSKLSHSFTSFLRIYSSQSYKLFLMILLLDSLKSQTFKVNSDRNLTKLRFLIRTMLYFQQFKVILIKRQTLKYYA